MSESVKTAFGLFDDDSSDDDEQVQMQQVQVQKTVVNLVEQLKRTPPPPAPSVAAATTTRPATKRPTSTHPLFPPWEDMRPKYVGPIALESECEDIGGGRGYVATEDLEPGTLVLMEHRYLAWPRDVDPTDPSFFITVLEEILQRDDYKQILARFRHLHPVQLSDLPEDVLTTGRAKYSAPLEQLRQQFASLELSHEELLRNVFGMQCNGFGSGVFLFNAMLNHDCNPNCVKFTPDTTASEGNDEDATNVSEVRVAKKIRKGEPLSISYLYPREQSRASRRKNLRDQFGFDCRCALCARGDSVMPAPTAPPTNGEDAVSLEDVEKVVASAEELLKDSGDGAQVLSVALEALSDALEIVAHDHFVLIRIHKLVADCCDEILKSRPSQDVREYAILFLRSSYELLELQKMYLNADHVDLARTLNDVSQGIQLLLSLDARVLLEEFPEWKDFRQASFVENKYRQDYQRIKRLYE